MKMDRLSLRVGAWVVAAAIFLKVVAVGALQPVFEMLLSPETACVLLFLETGRVVRPTVATEKPVQSPVEQPPVESIEPATFEKEDSRLVEVNSYCGYEVDPQLLLQEPLQWDLTQGGPKVLILHSHGSESYTKTENYTETTRYRTLNTQYNMVSIGDRLAQLLEDGGVEVIHDRSVHDYPSYTDAYSQSRKSVQKYLEQYPDICLVLDLHRDALQDSKGNQIGYTIDIDGQPAAKVMLVVGTDASGRQHPNWQENLSMAVKLHAQMEKTAPGVCRPISFRAQRFNQDLSTGAVILEVGAAGNTRQEALKSIEVVAKSILALSRGTETPVW